MLCAMCYKKCILFGLEIKITTITINYYYY